MSTVPVAVMFTIEVCYFPLVRFVLLLFVFDFCSLRSVLALSPPRRRLEGGLGRGRCHRDSFWSFLTCSGLVLQHPFGIDVGFCLRGLEEVEEGVVGGGAGSVLTASGWILLVVFRLCFLVALFFGGGVCYCNNGE